MNPLHPIFTKLMGKLESPGKELYFLPFFFQINSPFPIIFRFLLIFSFVFYFFFHFFNAELINVNLLMRGFIIHSNKAILILLKLSINGI